MVAKLFAVAVAVAGAMSQMIEERDPQSVNVGGQTITVTGAPPGSEIIIIATNAGGGASWSNINQPTGSTGTIHQVRTSAVVSLCCNANLFQRLPSVVTLDWSTARTQSTLL